MNNYNVFDNLKEKNKFEKLPYLRVNEYYLTSGTSLSEASEER